MVYRPKECTWDGEWMQIKGYKEVQNVVGAMTLEGLAPTINIYE